MELFSSAEQRRSIRKPAVLPCTFSDRCRRRRRRPAKLRRRIDLRASRVGRSPDVRRHTCETVRRKERDNVIESSNFRHRRALRVSAIVRGAWDRRRVTINVVETI